MFRTIKAQCRKHPGLTIGSLVSLLFLAGLLVLQAVAPDILALDSKWLVVAAIPLLLAILAGGYIKNFKGFGIELEANLHKPIDLSGLSATEAMETVSGDEKQTLSYLQELSERARKRIARLVVIEGRRDYYSAHVLSRYLQELPRLKYIEVRKSTGEFRALIPMKVLLHRQYGHPRYDIAEEQLVPFLRALEDGSVLANYREEALVRHVDTTTPVVEALRFMRVNRDSEIPVVDENFYFMGVLVQREVERQIVEIVLAQEK